MDGGAIFCVRDYARKAVTADTTALRLHKNKVGGYAYNDANTLLTKIERVLEWQLFEDSSDIMK